MTAKPWVVVAVMAMMCLMPYQSMDLNYLDEEVESKEGPGQGQGPADILLMGNSYVASNSLHNLIDGVMSAASTPANVSSLNGGGMRLSQHASNVASAGHQWNTTLNNGAWDWVVLQDQSQIPGFVRSQQEWINSKDGAVELAEEIEDNGGETILMMTWGRRAGDSINTQRFPDFATMQDELASGYLDYRDNITANGDTAWVAPVGLAFEHIHDKIVAEGGTPTDSGNTFYDLYSGDGSHPSLSGSYLAATVIYATITGDDPVGLSHSTSLSNALVLELQQAAAATVFNETSHLDYPWQTNSGGGGNGPSITIPANQTLAWDKVQNLFSSSADNVIDLEFDSNGDLLILGTSKNLVSVGSCTSTTNQYTGNKLALFITKIDTDFNCVWISQISTPDQIYTNQIVIDSNDDIFVKFSSNSNNLNTRNVIFEPDPFSLSYISPNNGGTSAIAKLSSDGNWTWTKIVTPSLTASNYISIDSSNNIWDSIYSNGQTTLLKFNSTTGANLVSKTLGNTPNNPCNPCVTINAIQTDSNDNLYAAGKFYATGSFMININGTSQNIAYGHSQNGWRPVVFKMNSNGDFLSYLTPISSSSAEILDIIIDKNDDIYATGAFYGDLEFGNTTLSAGGNQNTFITKINSNGVFEWTAHIRSTSTISPNKLALDYSNNIYISGSFWATSDLFFGGFSIAPAGAAYDGFIAKYSNSGIAQWAKSFGGESNDYAKDLHFYIGSLYVVTDYNSGIWQLGDLGNIANYGDYDIIIASMSVDYDGDEIADTNDVDDDADFIHDPLDSCHYSPLGFRSTGSSDHDSDGCDDETEDDDDDNDQLNDTLDSCPKGMTGWIRTNSSDLDNDGCMDALEDYDDDNDGFEDYDDYCSRVPGNSTMEFEKGCPDTDGDSRPDILDPFPNDASEWRDTDGDDVGDNSDAFPLDATQQHDTDGDTYGDEEFGNAGDSCPTVYGNSTIDRYGCLDSDGDGWSDAGDDFPNDPAEHLDSDSDGYPDSRDDFPFDPTQQTDSDGDGYGDNANGNLGDAYPNDASRYADSDRDGIDDQADAFPYDPTQTVDKDGDGMGDNPMGIGADKFPDDATQWGDIDGDGYGDNPNGTNPDAFPTDATQWSDADGDGYGDNPAGRLYDLFPDNPTQWIDEDGDGLGDNQSGTDADPYLNDFDNDGFNDTIDILPRLASPGDLDADGCLDVDDAFDENPLECLDTDGDGVGDNGDADDDNDGWTDADEGRANTDPLDPNDTPVDSFEIQIGNIGLGAWDLIGMFGGIPVFSWILFGFVTRNKRCSRYEDLLEEAQSRDELEQVALRWEYSLMLRLLGPHQGIRLERIRSELDDKFENAENMMAAEEFEPMTDVEQAPIVEAQAKDIPEIGFGPSISAEPDQIDENGYSWLMHEGKQWYRTNSESHWFEFEG